MNYQLAIIGGGPAGYTAAELAGKAGLSVVLFEKNSLGGVCLNEGCIPTKTLLYSAKVYDSAKHASKYAVQVSDASVDLPKVISRKNKVVRKLVLGIKARLTAAHVNLVTGEARIVDRHTIQCGEESYQCEKLMICTGSETFCSSDTWYGGSELLDTPECAGGKGASGIACHCRWGSHRHGIRFFLQQSGSSGNSR